MCTGWFSETICAKSLTPSKVYNAKPLLYFGPRLSHVTDLLDRGRICWEVSHGDVEGAVDALTQISAVDGQVLATMGRTAGDVVLCDFDPVKLSGTLCNLLSAPSAGVISTKKPVDY